MGNTTIAVYRITTDAIFKFISLKEIIQMSLMLILKTQWREAITYTDAVFDQFWNDSNEMSHQGVCDIYFKGN